MQLWRLVFLTESFCVPPNVVTNVKGLYPNCARQVSSLE